MAKQNNDLTLKVGFDIDKFQGEINKTTSVLNKWASGVQNSIMGVAAGFSALAIGEFVLDISKLAGEAEGVRAAFDKLPNSIMLMKELKEATSGTVSELELMKRSVMAQNFGINIEALPKLLEFAAVRAKQTGQSVSYLADSIVTGIGRKSALILDNLGISLAAINEELKVTPDYAKAVGNIAERELAKMGGMSENASTKIERLSADWDNLKVAIGDAANGTGVLGKALDGLSGYMRAITGDDQAERFQSLLKGVQNSIELGQGIRKAQFENLIALADQMDKKLNILYDKSGKITGIYETVKSAATVPLPNTGIMGIAAMMEEATKKTKLTAEELEKLNKKLFEQSELERQIRIAKLERSQQATEVSPMAQYANDLDAFVNKTAKIKGAMQQMSAPVVDFAANLQKLGLVAIDVGTIMQQGLVAGVTGFAEAFGLAVAGVGNFGDAIINSLLGFAKTVGQILVQAGAAVLLTKKFLLTNPVAAIAAGAALIAIAAGAQSKLRSATSSMGSGSAGGGGGASSGSRTENVGQRIELQVAFTGDAGKILKAQMIKQDRIDSRTRS